MSKPGPWEHLEIKIDRALADDWTLEIARDEILKAIRDYLYEEFAGASSCDTGTCNCPESLQD